MLSGAIRESARLLEAAVNLDLPCLSYQPGAVLSPFVFAIQTFQFQFLVISNSMRFFAIALAFFAGSLVHAGMSTPRASDPTAD